MAPTVGATGREKRKKLKQEILTAELSTFFLALKRYCSAWFFKLQAATP
jgi:hypothetical protein